VHERIISAVERAEFVRDRILYIILRGCWFDTVLNVHVPTENETDYMKGSFCHELDCVFNKFSKYHMEILLGVFIAKVDKEDMFKATILE
jgi:hypothetical protein